MPRKPKPPLSDGGDPQGMVAMMNQFFEWMRIRNYSEATVETRRRELSNFIEWTAARGVTRPNEVTKPILERYQRFMYHYRKANGGRFDLPDPERPPGGDPVMVPLAGAQQPRALQCGRRP